MNHQQQIVPGITVEHSGQATIDPALHDILLDLALALEGPTGLPVDIQHIVAAIVLAARQNELNADQPLIGNDPNLIAILMPHVKSVFKLYGGNLGDDD